MPRRYLIGYTVREGGPWYYVPLTGAEFSEAVARQGFAVSWPGQAQPLFLAVKALRSGDVVYDCILNLWRLAGRGRRLA